VQRTGRPAFDLLGEIGADGGGKNLPDGRGEAAPGGLVGGRSRKSRLIDHCREEMPTKAIFAERMLKR